MSVPEVNIARNSGRILDTQTRMEGLQTQHDNAIARGDTARANQIMAEIQRETSSMKRYESYTKFWEAALEVLFYLMGIATTVLRIRIT